MPRVLTPTPRPGHHCVSHDCQCPEVQRRQRTDDKWGTGPKATTYTYDPQGDRITTSPGVDPPISYAYDQAVSNDLLVQSHHQCYLSLQRRRPPYPKRPVA